MADTTNQPLGAAALNKTPETTVDVKAGYDEELLLFNPEENEIVVVEKKDAKAFLEEANEMQALCQELAKTRDRILELESSLTKAEKTKDIDTSGEGVAQLKREHAKAKEQYEAAYQKVDKALGKKGYFTESRGDGKKLLELVPLMKRRDGSPPKQWGRKWTYVRSDKIANHRRSYKLSEGDEVKSKSFIKDGKVDTTKIGEQLGKLETKVKADWRIGTTAGFVFPNLQAWAETINHKADPKKPVQFGAEVQLFRYFAGCGAGGEWKPKDGRIAGKIDGKAELMLGHGECKAEGFLPSAEGWVWALTGPKSGEEYLIGAIRLQAMLKLEAAAGASVAAEISLEVDYSKALPSVKGKHRPKKASESPKKIAVDKVETGLNGSAEAFAGVRAGGELTGALQFKNPQKDSKFEDMAKIGPKFEVQAGAGAAASLKVDFIGGKFRVYMKAALCLGLGAKGEVCFEVDAKQIVSFLDWFFHALLNMNFEYMEIFTEDAFTAAKQLQVMLVSGMNDAYGNLKISWKRFEDRIEREEGRIALMQNVLKNPYVLQIACPEAHGVLLYELTRHDVSANLSPPSSP